MTKTLKCNCKNKFQDEKYGNGNRVHNATKAINRAPWRCTVCGEERK